jgi:hypothetical protein
MRSGKPLRLPFNRANVNVAIAIGQPQTWKTQQGKSKHGKRNRATANVENTAEKM